MNRRWRVQYIPPVSGAVWNPTTTLSLRDTFFVTDRSPHEQHYIDHIARLASEYARTWGDWPTWVVMNDAWYESVCIEWGFRMNPRAQEAILLDTLPFGGGEGTHITLAPVAEPLVGRTAPYDLIRRKSGKDK